MTKFRGPQVELKFARDRATGLVSSVNPKGAIEWSTGIIIGHSGPSDIEDCMIQYDSLEECTAAIWMDGNYSLWKGNVDALVYPVRIEWKLLLGVGGCMADTPFVGVTILKSAKDLRERSGRIFQVNCTPAQTMWLCARVVDNINQDMIRLSVKTIFQSLSGGHPMVVVGNAIG